MNKMILAVDDRPEILSTLTNILQGDYKVIALRSAHAALNAIQVHSPDLFLLDIEMPGMNGYELAKKIRLNYRFAKTPILFLTGKDNKDDVITAVKNGGNDYILKPINKDLLLERVKLNLLMSSHGYLFE